MTVMNICGGEGGRAVLDPAGRLWHVTVTVAGDAVEPMLVRNALARLSEQRPFIDSVSFTDVSAELQFWDEGQSMLDVASLALRVWTEHRESAGLPLWEVVGLEVIEKSVHDRRGSGHSLGFHSPASVPFRL